MYKVIAFNLITKGSPELARRLHKVHAFDTRFTLHKQPEYQNSHVQSIYLLDVPLFDKYFEAIFTDGTKKLLSDEEAIEILRKESDYLDEMRDLAGDQLKNSNKFAKMGNIELYPELVKKKLEEKLAKDKQQAEEEAAEDTDDEWFDAMNKKGKK